MTEHHKKIKAIIIAWLIVLSIFYFIIWIKIGMIDRNIDDLISILKLDVNNTLMLAKIASLHTESIHDLQQAIK